MATTFHLGTGYLVAAVAAILVMISIPWRWPWWRTVGLA